MKRPLAVFGFTLLTFLLCNNYFDSRAVALCAFFASAVLFVFSLCFKKLRQHTVLPTALSAVMIGCLLFFCFQTHYNAIINLCGDEATVEAEVYERPYYSAEKGRHYCYIKVKSLSGQKVNTRMRLSFSGIKDEIDPDELVIGNRLTFTATVYQSGSSDKASRDYFKSHSVYLGAYSAENMKIEPCKYRPIGYYIDKLRHYVTENLLHDFDSDTASLLIAVLTGDKDCMDSELYTDFKKSGIVHIMAVSGMHLSVLVLFLGFFMELKGRRGKLLALFTMIFVVFMMNFASFTGSVKRAGMMTLLYLFGQVTGKSSDSLNSLGFACICVLFVNPFAVSDVSFLLSFLATLGIIVMAFPLSERIMSYYKGKSESNTTKSLLKIIVTSFSISISVMLFTFPVSVYYFGGISLISPLTNLLLLPCIAPLIILTFLYSFLRLVPFVGLLLSLILKYISLYMTDVCSSLSELRYSYVSLNSDYLKYWFIMAFVMSALAFLLYKYKKTITRYVSIFMVCTFIVWGFSEIAYSVASYKITVVDSREGSCCIVSMNGKGILVGCDTDYYSKQKLKETVSTLGVKIYAALLDEKEPEPSLTDFLNELDTDKIITDDGSSITISGTVTVTKKDGYVAIEGGGINCVIFNKDYLQDYGKCDIIIGSADMNGKQRVVLDGRNSFSTEDLSNITITVGLNGGLVIRGENSWLNLMKRNSNSI